MVFLKNRSLRLLFLSLLLVTSLFAFAQTAPMPAYVPMTSDALSNTDGTDAVPVVLTQSFFAASTEQAIAAFNNLVKMANAAINSIRGNADLKNYGQRLTLMLTGIVIVWSIIKNIALKQSLPQLIGDMVFPLVIASFVIGAGLGRLPEVIDQTTTAVAGIFNSSPAETMESSLASGLFNSMAKIWNTEKADSGVLSSLASPLVSLAMVLLRIGIILLLLVSAGLGVAAILIAKFQMALAIALAPLFIPWIVFKPTEFLFSGWLNFFLKSGFGLVGIFAVSAVVTAGTRQMASLITTTDSSVAGVMTFAAMGAMAIIFTYLMLKGADIGEGIISGSATGIGQLASVAKGSAAMAPGRMAASTAGVVGSTAKVGAAVGAGRAVAMKGGQISEAGRAAAGATLGKGVARAAFEMARGGGTKASAGPATSSPSPATATTFRHLSGSGARVRP